MASCDCPAEALAPVHRAWPGDGHAPSRVRDRTPPQCPPLDRDHIDGRIDAINSPAYAAHSWALTGSSPAQLTMVAGGTVAAWSRLLTCRLMSSSKIGLYMHGSHRVVTCRPAAIASTCRAGRPPFGPYDAFIRAIVTGTPPNARAASRAVAS